MSGIAYFMKQDWKNAAQCFETVLVYDPDNTQARNYLADLAIEQNNLDVAEDHLRRASKSNPADLDTLQRLAYVLQCLENMAEATDIYSKILAQDPGSAEIHLNYGYALFKSDQTQEAIDAYRAAIRLNPGLGLAHINLGSALSELDQDKEAIAAFRIGLKTHANHVEGLIGLARCLRAQDEYEDAALSFKKALDLAKDQSNDRSAVYWEMGYSLELSGDKDGGRTAYEKCLEHHPDHGVARHLLNALIGNTTETAPPDYVQDLFDDYAKSFDDNLVNELNYAVPKLIGDKLKSVIGKKILNSVLDLGGGTGLIAAEVRDLMDKSSSEIHGVDLSSGMIEIANQKNRYDQSFVSDIGLYLTDSSQGLANYDAILSGDVFVYIGNLVEIFAGVALRLQQDGHFIFSVERLEKGDFELQSTGRYAHSKKYINGLANGFGFFVESVTDIIPRMDGNTEIKGLLFCLIKT